MKQAMEEEQLDALICCLPENVLLLSGYWPLVGFSFLVFPLDGEPTCIVPRSEEKEARGELWWDRYVSFAYGVLEAGDPYEHVEQALESMFFGHNWSRIGIEGSFECVAPPWNAAEHAVPADTTRRILEGVFGAERLVDASDFLHAQRARKTRAETKKLRVANEVASFGLQAFSELVAPGITGVELVAEVERAIMVRGTGYKGAKRVRGFAQVATGPLETSVGYQPMEISTTRKMESGDLALLELGVVVDGFWSDRTRVRSAGSAKDQAVDVFEVVSRAQSAAIERVRAGAAAREVDEAARAVIRDAGYAAMFPHVTGHGVGLRYHEPTPLICPGSDLTLEPGMVCSVEPGIYFPEMGGIRLEDNVVVTETGCEVLGPFERELA